MNVDQATLHILAVLRINHCFLPLNNKFLSTICIHKLLDMTENFQPLVIRVHISPFKSAIKFFSYHLFSYSYRNNTPDDIDFKDLPFLKLQTIHMWASAYATYRMVWTKIVTTAFQLCFRNVHENREKINYIEFMYFLSILNMLVQEMEIQLPQKLNFYSRNLKPSYLMSEVFTKQFYEMWQVRSQAQTMESWDIYTYSHLSPCY
jgi:hypothetical protein